MEFSASAGFVAGVLSKTGAVGVGEATTKRAGGVGRGSVPLVTGLS
ncbi:MAG: hypothetical protein RLZZ112_241, partial [Verrucomicrobiota bacterium]